jgi:hypothetical protein
MEVNSARLRHGTLWVDSERQEGAKSAPVRGTAVRRRMRFTTIVFVLLLVLTTSCTKARHLDGASSCADFIHAGMAQRSDAVTATARNARFAPATADAPTVAAVSMVCDAYPDISVAEAMGSAVERS